MLRSCTQGPFDAEVNDKYSQDAYSLDVYDDGWSREEDDGCSGDDDECDDGWSREEEDGHSDDDYE